MTYVLFVGDLRPHTRTTQRLQALCRIGARVTSIATVPFDEVPPDGRAAPFLDRIRDRLGLPRDPTSAADALCRAVGDARPDVVWIETAPGLKPRHLKAARALAPAARFALFSEDDLVRPSNRTHPQSRALPLYDIVFTTKRRNLAPDGLPALGARRVVFTPKTFDPSLHRPREVSGALRRELGSPVGFIGTFEESRARSLASVARAGFQVRVFGSGWTDWRDRPPGLEIEERPLRGDTRVDAVIATGVNLGLPRHANGEEHTDRSVEVPACGAFLLAERTDEHRRLFREGEEIALFGDDTELIEMLRRYCHDADKRARIGAAGRARCLADGYDHDSGLRRMLGLTLGESAEVAPRGTEPYATEAKRVRGVDLGDEVVGLRPGRVQRPEQNPQDKLGRGSAHDGERAHEPTA